MRPATNVHDALADLLEYPREGHAERVRALAAAAAAGVPGAGEDLREFAESAARASLGESEELYVRTFDANAERALEVGWQVFGEQYERGAFLVDLRGRMRALGVPETAELPDHMTQVLRLLGRMDEDDARTLVARAVSPSLRRVREHVEAGNPYAGVLDAIARTLAWAGGPETTAPAPGAGAAARCAAAAAGTGGGR